MPLRLPREGLWRRKVKHQTQSGNDSGGGVLQDLVVYETVLSPGDILFIPEGWAHQALNLEWTAMASSNYVDRNNLPNILSLTTYDQVRAPPPLQLLVLIAHPCVSRGL